MRTKKKMIWDNLVVLEPRLLFLEKRIKAIKDDGQSVSFCANQIWYARFGFKDVMSRLVGWEVETMEATLVSSEAYDVAYKHLYDLLPNCRNCACL